MTKYYFIAYKGCTFDNISISGGTIYKVENSSFTQIVEAIKEVNNLKSAVVTSMKDLTKKEYEMLKGTPEE